MPHDKSAIKIGMFITGGHCPAFVVKGIDLGPPVYGRPLKKRALSDRSDISRQLEAAAAKLEEIRRVIRESKR